jgi:hypothetical protein
MDYASIITQFFAVLTGFEMVRRSTSASLAEHTSNIIKLLQNKVDVVTYQAKVRELHDKINALEVEVAILKDRHAKR